MNNHYLPPPIGALPDYMRNLVCATAIKLDVDVGMALATLLSGMASAVHGLKVAKRPDGGIEPLSLFNVVLAGPTTGKTRTHKLVHRAHSAQDSRRYQDYRQAKKDRQGIKHVTAEQGEQPLSAETDDAPRLRWTIIQNSSNRGLLEAVEGVGEASAMSSHEGQNLLNSDVFRRHLETLNMLFDGDDKVMLTRARGSVVMAANATLIIHVMVQHDMFDNYCEKYGDYARGIGFLARALFTSVPSTPTFIDRSIQVPHDCLGSYDNQVMTYLDVQREKLEAGITAREEMAFSPEACQLYWELTQDHKYLTRTTYWHMQDAANRAMQNVIRVASIMHAFSGEAGDIPPQALEAAYAIVQWHLGQFAEIFPPKPITLPPPPKLSARERALQRQSQRQFDDRHAILSIITDLCQHNRESSALKSEVMTLFREHAYDARFRAALLRLVKAGEVLETGNGKEARLNLVPQRTAPPVNPPLWQPYLGSL